MLNFQANCNKPKEFRTRTATGVVWPYLVAIGAASLAILIRLLLHPFLEDNHPFIIALFTVVLVAWYRGLGPALVSLVLGMLAAAYLFLPPYYRLTIIEFSNQLGLLLYGLCGVACALLGELQRRAQARNLASLRQLTVQQKVLEEEIRQRRLIEEELRASEARFRLLADAMPQIVWTTDSTGRLDYVNHRWSEYSGASREPTEERLQDEAIHPEDREGVAENWQHALESGGVFEREFRLRRVRDGSYRWHLGRALPLRDARGQVLAWFGTSTDIEDQKRAEQTILQANEELERRVAERTRQLEASNQELRRAILLAEAASRAKSEFLAGVSHEIRTPMNGILGMAEMLLDSRLSDRQRDCLQALRTSAESLLALLNEILDFSKVEAGKLELHPGPFDLRRQMEEILKPLALRAQHKGLAYRCAIDPLIPAVLVGDSLRLQQVLLNLVGNAVKFTEKGEVVVTVTSDEWRVTSKERPQAPAEDSSRLTRHSSLVTLHFSISDTGIGIPADKQKSIFEPFVQADSSLSRRYGGTGLGLSISARLVEMMGGQIEVVSRPEQGSSFSFTVELELPAVVSWQLAVGSSESRPSLPDRSSEAPELTTDNRQLTTATHEMQLRKLPTLRVLLVEDNDFNRQVGVYLLHKQGHRVSVACSGAEALERLEREPFDLVLMDLSMPGMDGLQTTAALRQRESAGSASGCSGRHVPVVALTAHTTPEDHKRCLQAGMDGHLTKPLDSEQLRQLLVELLGDVHLCADAPAQEGTGDKLRTPPSEASLLDWDWEPVFDPEQTLKRLSGNRELLVEVARLFQDNSPAPAGRDAPGPGPGRYGCSAESRTHPQGQYGLLQRLERPGRGAASGATSRQRAGTRASPRRAAKGSRSSAVGPGVFVDFDRNSDSKSDE